MLRCRKLYLKLVSADKLPNVRKNGRMKVYAKVSVNGIPNTRMKTHVDMAGETNPRWNFCVEYTLDEAAVRSEAAGLEVVVKLYCERLFEDRFIGEVKIAVKSLFDDGRGSVMGSGVAVSYGVGGTRQGRLNIIYSFGEMFLEPVPTSSSSWKKMVMKKVFVGLLARGAVFLVTGAVLGIGN